MSTVQGLPDFKAKPCGDSAVMFEFGVTIDPWLNACVNALDRAVRKRQLAGIVETIPTYRALMIHYDPCLISYRRLTDAVRELSAMTDISDRSDVGAHWRVPVAYGDNFGMDFSEMAARSGLTHEQLIDLHTSRPYLVYQFGFSPGIALLGKIDACLEHPRRAEPRPIIPAGSIVIAGLQTAIISLPVHSGWHIVGRTPVRAFDLERDPMFIFNPGDSVSFFAIEEEQWSQLDKAAAAGELVAERVTTP